MRRRIYSSVEFDIKTSRSRPLLIGAAAGLLAAAAGAQSLDATVADTLDNQVDQQVAEQLDATVEDAVTQSVESTVSDAVGQQVESAVAETVEQQVASGVVETVEQQVESGVLQTVEGQVEAGVTTTIEQQVEAGVEAAVEDVVEAGAGVAPDDVEGAAERGGTQGTAGSDAQGTETFAAAVDAAGRAIERNVWVVLVPAEHADRIEAWGFTVRERRDLDGLDRVLLRVDAPEDRDLAEAALELAVDAPGTLVDMNHLYETSQAAGGAGAAALGAEPLLGRAAMPRAATARIAEIGMIDSAVAVDHPALSGTAVEQRDFVPFAGARPVGHGTAVASILGGGAGSRGRGPAVGKLWAASVFFEDGSGAQIATTASLVSALDWLARARRVRVINMSLQGPANHVLEAAIDDVAASGVTVVAAVGNNGPTGAPLYPAAYEAVVGVTAVDAERRIYRYANRGRHVRFAAPGVKVRVAADDGGFRTETGTSMAAPYAAALLAAAAAVELTPTPQIVARFERGALDLGKPGFDEVYGFGLIVPER